MLFWDPNQKEFPIRNLGNCNVQNLKATDTPMLANVELVSKEPPINNPLEYRRIVGSIQYITLTRPDVQLAVNRLSQFMSTPRQVHWTTMMRVLRYLSGTQTYGVVIQQEQDFRVTTYCDANWGGDTLDRKSRTGLLIYVGGNLVYILDVAETKNT